MPVYTLLQIGTFHTLHCEDDLIVADLGPGRMLLAVMDGCTMGTDSHLPSTLCAKLLRKIARALDFEAFRTGTALPLVDLQRTILRQLFEELGFLQNHIQLEPAELLCTLVLAVLDTKAHTAEVIAVGDGWVDCNGIGTEFEQDNRPDYLGYHLKEDFEQWYAAQTQRLSFSDVHDLSIATDGILSFQQAELGNFEALDQEGIVQLLLRKTDGQEATTMLQAQIKHIARAHGLRPTDDLAIARVVL
jgi:hypothetical protein